MNPTGCSLWAETEEDCGSLLENVLSASIEVRAVTSKLLVVRRAMVVVLALLLCAVP